VGGLPAELTSESETSKPHHLNSLSSGHDGRPMKMNRSWSLLSLLSFLVPLALGAEEKVHPTGYTDTPVLPNTPQWKVHDDNRPRPTVVTPAKEAGQAPSDAIVLFDGKGFAAFRKKDGGEVDKPVVNGAFAATSANKAQEGDIFTKESFGDMQLHVEWTTPNPPQSNSQHRGNSGIFIQDRYELQVLDCFNNKTYADGQAGSIYGEVPPLVNAMRPPGEWQTYDVIWVAPRFEGEKLISPARLTVLHNGVCVQASAEPFGPTGHKSVQLYKPHGDGPLRFQDHHDLPSVQYRNVWVRRLVATAK
jgi:Domain of Unknown Function (DUF1080)